MKNAILNLLKTLFFFDAAVVAVYFLPFRVQESAARSALSEELVFLAVVAVLTVIFSWIVERRSLKIFSFKKLFRHYSIGLICGILPIGATFLALWLSRCFRFTEKNNIEDLLIWLAALFVNTFAVELLLRGYLFRLYRKHYPFVLSALFVTALYFSLNYTVFLSGPVRVFNLLVFNLILCYTAEYTRSFLSPLTAHFIYRAIGTFLLGSLTVSEKYPHLFQMTVSGNPKLTGGEVGIEGSLLLLFFQLLVLLWFIRNDLRNRKINWRDFVEKIRRFFSKTANRFK